MSEISQEINKWLPFKELLGDNFMKWMIKPKVLRSNIFRNQTIFACSFSRLQDAAEYTFIWVTLVKKYVIKRRKNKLRWIISHIHLEIVKHVRDIIHQPKNVSWRGKIYISCTCLK